ncbi:MAG: SGNH/GDSL hydrolase family protein [Pirellulales bacterium]|jgi:hypothetical protein|nr:SGNH/GDSL hydrolase family protein [Planctomycetia bacterium]
MMTLTTRHLPVLLLPLLWTCFVDAAEPIGQPRQRRQNPAMAPITDVAGLPRVLLIGDSISIGYTLATRELLAGKANVHRIPTNGGPTTRGLDQLDAWLGNQQWDVIHFNWGLHDLKHINDHGSLVDVAKGPVQVPLEAYRKNLQTLTRRLKATGADLIWCSTTPIPQGAKGRVPGDEVRYNSTALKVMQDEGVAVDDLYAFALPQMAKIGKPADVHYTPTGSRVLATQVARSIEAVLKSRRSLPATGR